MVKKIPWSLLSVLIVAIVVTYPVWRSGLTTNGDAIFHSMWYTNFSRQVFAGDWYPRWLSSMNSGLGSPVLFFYGPLPYYCTLLFAPFGTHDQFGLSQLGFSAALSFLGSGLAAYLWLRQSSDEKSAGVGAIFYVLAPYHLKVDLYSRCAFAELWAFVWIPLILYFVTRILDNNRLALVGIAISYFALIVTHMPSVVIFSLVPLVYSLLRSDSGQRFRCVVVTSIGLVGGAGLSSIYLLPAMTMQQEISMADFRAASYPERWLHYKTLSLTDTESQLFWSVVIMAALSITAGLASWYLCRHRKKRELLFCELLALASTFFMFPVSNSIWQLFKTLQSIQFPWRFSSLLCLATAGVIANSLTCVTESFRFSSFIVAAVPGSLFVVLALFAGYTVWRSRPAGRGVTPTPEFLTRFDRLRDAAEYRPANAHSIQQLEFEDLIADVCKDGPTLAKACVSRGSATITTKVSQPRWVSFDVNAQSDASVKVSQFYFTGWRAYEGGREVSVRAASGDGLVEFDLPPGLHSVELKLTSGAPEVAGKYLSLFSFALLVCLLFSNRLKSHSGL